MPGAYPNHQDDLITLKQPGLRQPHQGPALPNSTSIAVEEHWVFYSQQAAQEA